jgi:tetratricopeptide (TPR) repeat protein
MTYEEMVLEVNNTKATLLLLLESTYEDHFRLVNASKCFTMFCTSIGDHSEKVISQAVEFVQRNSGDVELLIECFQTWGKFYYSASNLEKAQEKLQEAERLCISSLLIHGQLYGCVLEDLGEICHQLDEFSNAEAYYQNALKLHQDSNDIQHQGNSYYGLGRLSFRQGKINEASTFYQSAIQCHESVNAILNLGDDYTDLGQIYLQQNRLVEAESAFQDALKFHRMANSFLGQGHDYKSIGDLYLKLNKPDDTRDVCEKALEIYKSVNSFLGQGQVHQIFGDIHIYQKRMNEAEISFKKALEFSTIANYAYGQGVAFSWLGHIYMSRGQFHGAKEMLEKAILFHQKAQNSDWENHDAEKLSTVIAQIEERQSMEQGME